MKKWSSERANHARSAIKPHVRNGAMVVLMLLACSERASEVRTQNSRALSDPNVLSPVMSLEPGDLVPADGAKSPAIASGDGVHLLAWEDGPHVRFILVKASDGTPINPTPLSVALDREECGGSMGTPPGVAYGAGTFAIAWTGPWTVCAVRVGRDGTVLDKPATVLARGRNFGWPGVSFGGDHFFVVWQDGRTVAPPTTTSPNGAEDLWGGRMRVSDGKAMDGNGFPISTAADIQRYPSVAFDGTNHLVIWADQRSPPSMWGARVRGSDGKLLDPAGFMVSDYWLGRSALAFDGKHMLAVWQGRSALYGARVRSSDGAVIDKIPTTLVPRSTIEIPNMQPRLLYDGKDHLLAWRDENGNIILRRISTDMMPVGEPTKLQPVPILSDAVVASLDGRPYAAWTTNTWSAGRGWTRLYGSILDSSSLQAGPSLLLFKTARVQLNQTVSFDGRHHLAVWYEWDGSGGEIRGARLRDDDGTLRDPKGFPITTIPASPGFHGVHDNMWNGNLASNGSNHLLIWGESNRLRGLRIRADDASILDATPLEITTDSAEGLVSSDGEDYLVLWRRPSAGIFAMKVRGDTGAFAYATPKEVSGSASSYGGTLTFVGSQYLLGWLERTSSTAPTSVHVRGIDRDGMPIGAPLRLDNEDAEEESSLLIAGGNSRALLKWSELRGNKVRPIELTAGQLVASTASYLPLSENYPVCNRLAFDGANFLAAGRTFPKADDSGFYRLTPDGVALDPQGVRVGVDSAWGARDLAISPGANRVLAVFRRFDSAPGVATYRMGFQWAGSPAGAAKPDASESVVDAGVPLDAKGPTDTLPASHEAPAPLWDATVRDVSPTPDVAGANGTPDAGAPLPNESPKDAAAPTDHAVADVRHSEAGNDPVDAAAVADVAHADVGGVFAGGDAAFETATPSPGRDGSVEAALPSDGASDRGGAHRPPMRGGCAIAARGESSNGISAFVLLAIVLAMRLRRRSGLQRPPGRASCRSSAGS
jgi:hypothetical protein